MENISGSARDFSGYIIDAPGQEHWTPVIGRFILNFSAVEAQSHEWIRQLQHNVSYVDDAHGSVFGGRIRTVRALLDQIQISPQTKAFANAAWDSASTLALFRNKIAHSPLAFVWKGRTPEGEPNALGWVAYQGGSGEQEQPLDLIALGDIEQNAAEACQVAQHLQQLLDQLLAKPAPRVGSGAGHGSCGGRKPGRD